MKYWLRYKANLPTAARTTTKPDMVTLTVDKYGQVAVENKTVSFPDLLTLLTNRASLNTNLPVYISGDKDATHGAIINVLNLVRQAGIQKVSFAISPAPPVRPQP